MCPYLISEVNNTIYALILVLFTAYSAIVVMGRDRQRVKGLREAMGA